jgi:hypothetical protein
MSWKADALCISSITKLSVFVVALFIGCACVAETDAKGYGRDRVASDEPTYFVILSPGRSGSVYLTTMLRAKLAERVCTMREVLMQSVQRHHIGQLSLAAAASFDRILDEILMPNKGNNSGSAECHYISNRERMPEVRKGVTPDAIGFKLLYHQCPSAGPDQGDRGKRRVDSLLNVAPSRLMKRCDPAQFCAWARRNNVHVVWLERDNVLDTALSRVEAPTHYFDARSMAKQRAVAVAPADVIAWLDFIVDERDAWRQALYNTSAGELHVLEVSYDALVEQTEFILRQIEWFLSIKPHKMSPRHDAFIAEKHPGTVRGRSALSRSERFADWADIEAAVRKHPSHRHFL